MNHILSHQNATPSVSSWVFKLAFCHPATLLMVGGSSKLLISTKVIVGTCSDSICQRCSDANWNLSTRAQLTTKAPEVIPITVSKSLKHLKDHLRNQVSFETNCPF